MDAITLLRADHKKIEKLFKSFEKAGPNAVETKRRLVQSMITELAVHASIEEQLFYPAVRDQVPEDEELALESIEEHHVVKWVLSELDGMEPTDERFGAKVAVLMDLVRHHVDEEESEMFPSVRSAVGRKPLQDLGASMDAAKQVAPHRPHPRSPDTPPANMVVGAVAGTVDRALELVGRAVGR